MRSVTKIFQNQINQVLISFLIVISSFFLVNSSAKAATDYSTYFYEYDSEFVDSTINHENFKTAYDKLMEYYTNGNYKNYLIYAFYNGNNIKLSILLFDTEDITINFGLTSSNIGLSFTHGYEYNCTLSDLTCTTSAINRSKTSIISFSGGSNKLTDENIIKNTFLINDSRKFFIYESSTDKIYTKNPSIEHFKDSEGNILDKIPVAKKKANITFEQNNYKYTNGDKEYVYAVDVKINFNVDDKDKYYYLYKFPTDEDDSWYTYTPIKEPVSTTIHLTENKAIYVKIVNKETDELVYDVTWNVVSINYKENYTLKKTYNSGTNGNDLYSLNITNLNKDSVNYDIPFKIQFGSNDFSNSYVPRIVDIKGYYGSDRKKEDKNVKIKDFKCYREVEGDSEVFCTGTMTKNLSLSAYYEIIFENTENYYLYYYDNFSDDYRTLDITTNLFKDYNKYRFKDNSNKAYISLKNKNQSNKKGSVILPSYYVTNDELNVRMFDYNSYSNVFENEHVSLYLEDKYYRKFDFEITDTIIPVLTNKKDKHCETYRYGEGTPNIDEGGYYTWIGDIKTFVPFSHRNNYLFSSYNEAVTCYQEEPVYFYVHKDFLVTFNKIDENKESIGNVPITDEEGNVILVVGKDDDNTNIYKEENKGFFDLVSESFSFFTKPLMEFLNMFNYFWNGLNIIIKYFIVFVIVFLLVLFILKFLL